MEPSNRPYTVKGGVVVVTRYLAVTLAIVAAVMVVLSNTVPDAASSVLQSIGYVVFACAVLALLLMLLANWLGWSPEEFRRHQHGAEGTRGRASDHR